MIDNRIILKLDSIKRDISILTFAYERVIYKEIDIII